MLLGELPVGAVVPFAGDLDGSPAVGTTSPIERWGWLPCDGRALEVGQYRELFAALGYRYGGSGNSFNLPDYRGYFLRGVDGGSGNDPDAGTREPPSAGQPADSVGSIQQGALERHCHTYDQPVMETATAQEGGPPVPAINSNGCTANTGSSGSYAAETRPKNVYVNFIIKFTYGYGRRHARITWDCS